MPLEEKGIYFKNDGKWVDISILQMKIGPLVLWLLCRGGFYIFVLPIFLWVMKKGGQDMTAYPLILVPIVLIWLLRDTGNSIYLREAWRHNFNPAGIELDPLLIGEESVIFKRCLAVAEANPEWSKAKVAEEAVVLVKKTKSEWWAEMIRNGTLYAEGLDRANAGQLGTHCATIFGENDRISPEKILNRAIKRLTASSGRQVVG